MLKEYRAQTILGVWGGLFFCAAGWLIFQTPLAYRHFGALMLAGGYVLFVSGCIMYAKGKGWDGLWGLLGILGPPGLLFLYALRDKSKLILRRRRKEGANPSVKGRAKIF